MNTGDKVKVITNDHIVEGTLMPGNEEFHVVKLDNGYNLGISKEGSRIQLIKTHLKKVSKAKKQVQDLKLPKILILHTGGTIASRVDYNTGGTIAQFSPDELLLMFPELLGIAQIQSKLIRNMQSDDMRFIHFNLIAKEIEKGIKSGYEGIIITHGTDTMHYTSAAISFMIQDPGIPIIFVGSQRSSDRGSSDSALNLLNAVRFASKADFSGVATCMHENLSDKSFLIIPGTKVRKMHTSRRDTFRPINCTAIARVSEDSIKFLSSHQKRKKGKLNVTQINPKIKIGILKSHPNMYASEVLAYEQFDGLILEGTGLGHFPITEIDDMTKEHPKILKAIISLSKKGIAIVMAPQTIYGRINMNVYSPGRIIQKAGVTGNYSDMTPETTFIKLAWLLSNYPNEWEQLISKNLVGEISEHIGDTEFLN